MIARLWRGWTRPEHADAYEIHFRKHIRPSVLAVSGCLGAELLRRDEPGGVEFVAVSYFETEESIAGFAGADREQAVVSDEARMLLARFEERAGHYRVIVRS